MKSDNTSLSAFGCATKRGHIDIVKMLYQHLVDTLNPKDIIEFVNGADTEGGWTPFHLACVGGHGNVVKYLTDVVKVDIFKEDHDNKTGRIHAKCNNFEEISSFLFLLEIQQRSQFLVDGYMKSVDSILSSPLPSELIGIIYQYFVIDEIEESPLHTAISLGYMPLIEELLAAEKESEEESQKSFGRIMQCTQLPMAIECDHELTFRALVADGRRFTKYVMFRALDCGSYKVVGELLR